MLEERDIYAREDPVYKTRQEALRDMEEERQAGKLPPRTMTWDELKAETPPLRTGLVPPPGRLPPPDGGS